MITQSLPSQVLVSGAGSEAAAATRRGVQGTGDLAGVPGRRSSQLHQPGLPQLRAHQPEPQRPRKIQLRGRSGGLALSLRGSSHWFLHARLLTTRTNTEPLHLTHFTPMTKVEWMSVVVLGLNEAANSMNGRFHDSFWWWLTGRASSRVVTACSEARTTGLTRRVLWNLFVNFLSSRHSPHLSVCCRSTSSS